VLIPVDYGYASSLTGYYLIAGVPGMKWNVGVQAPTGTSYGNGTVEVIQLCNPLSVSWISAASGSYSASGLDVQFPYLGVPASNPWTSSDSPNISLTGDTSATMSDTFADYLMFFPPNSQTCVPIGYYTWSASGTATSMTGVWAAQIGVAGGIVGPSGTFGNSTGFPVWSSIVSGKPAPSN
jgi:hypothetical protein